MRFIEYSSIFSVKVNRFLPLLKHSGWISALFTWPEFSATDFNMVSELTKQGVQPRTVLDVGANVGQLAVAASKLFPHVQVYSFEPVPEPAARLHKNVSDLGNVAIFPLALGDSEGKITFYVNAFGQSSSALSLAAGHL